jgi:Calcineurin-like phosphoesterase
MHIENTLPKIEDALSILSPDLLKKITVVGNEPVKKKIGDVTFLCGTMWTDYGKHRTQKDEVHRLVSQYINDHRGGIKIDDEVDPRRTRSFSCTDGQKIFDNTIEHFDKWMTEIGDNTKTVIVTHHMPTFQAVHPQYCMDEMTRMINHAFASNCESLMEKHNPTLWFFGHTHIKWIGTIGKTKLHCNPYGYPHEPTAQQDLYDTTKVYTL